MTKTISTDPAKQIRRVLVSVLAASMVFVLAGCNQNDRPLTYDKGNYAGQKDQKIDPDTVRALESRSNYQRISN